MSYVKGIYDIENKAREVITKKLDEVESILLWSGLDNPDWPDFLDELYDLPNQIYIYI